jgi:plastocyanin
MRRISLIALTVALFWGTTLPVRAASTTVEAQDNKFSPANFTVAAGDKVVFKNTGQAPHTATAKDGSFDTGNLDPGESKSVTVAAAGTIKFVCKYHETIGMTGTITASGQGAAAAPATSPSPSPSASAAAKGPGSAVPATPPPASEKYFPKIAFGLLVLLLMLIGIGYLRTAMHNAQANRS